MKSAHILSGLLLALILALPPVACGPSGDQPADDPSSEDQPADDRRETPAAPRTGLEDARPAAREEAWDATAIAAKVNGETISRRLLAGQAALAAADLPLGDGETERTPAELAALEAEQLENLISLELACQEALRLGYAPSADELAEALELYKKDFEAPEQLYKTMDQYGSTEEDLKKQLNKLMALKKWRSDEFLAEMAVSDAAAQKFYQENLDRMRHGEMTRFSQILVGVSLLAQPAVKERARAKAEAALRRLAAGEDFGTVASEVNADPEAAANRGDLGWFVRGQNLPVIEEAAWNLPIGGRTGLLESILGFHIVQVSGRRPAGLEPFEALKPEIVEFVSARKLEAAVDRRLKELFRAADIEIPDPALKAALDRLRAAPGPSAAELPTE